MKKARLVVVYGVLIFSFFWSFGCRPMQPFTQEFKPSPEGQLEQLTPGTPEGKMFTHKIKWSGENIMRISSWYTGSGSNWLRIVDVNPSIDPRRMKIGDTIVIPENLLKTREPMPISYRMPGTAKKSKEVETSAESLPDSSEIDIFGPVDIELQTGGVEESDSPLPLETIE